ncbi:SpaA isopeptide-forming pilin-related protein [Salibacterium sp. K-3]
MARKFNISAVIFILIFQLIGSGAGVTPSVMAEDTGATDETSVTDDVYNDNDTVTNDVYNDDTVTNDVYQDQTVTESVYNNDPSGEISENILDNADLAYSGDSVDTDTIMELNYDWALENGHGYKEGATFNFTLPEEFDVYDPVEGSEMTDGNGELVGYFSVDKSGAATVEFTDYIENYSNVSGELQVLTTISEETDIESGMKVTVTPIEGGDSIEIPVNFSGGDPGMSKTGTPERNYNAQNADWSAQFNKTLETINDPVFEDTLDEGMEFVEGSVDVYYLDVKMDGTVDTGSAVPEGNYTVDTSGTGLSVDFGSEINKAYQVDYETNLTDQSKTEFTNNASLKSGDSTEGSAEASISVERGDPLDKRTASYDNAAQIIEWETMYNYNQRTISSSEAVIEDNFFVDGAANPFEIVEDIEVQEMTIDKNGNASENGTVDPSQYNVTYDSDGHGYTLQFNNEINGAYKLSYQTEAVDRVFNDNGTVVNNVYAGGEEASAQQNFGQGIVHKSNSNADYQNKTVDWTITLNRDGYEMNNLQIDDTFTSGGLTLDEGNFTSSTGLVKGVDYEVVNTGGDNFTINFLQPIDSEHSITYTTSFDYADMTWSNDYFQNDAAMSWEDSSGQEYNKSATSTFEPDSYTQMNGFKNGSYNAVDKEITWNVGVNYNLQDLSDVVVEDYIQGNQQLVESSISVYEIEPGEDPDDVVQGDEVDPANYTVNTGITDGNGNPGFEIDFGDISTSYLVTYQTSLDGLDLVEDSYNNTASVNEGGTESFNLDAEVSIPHGGSYTDKSGEQDGKIVNWQVDVNFAQSQIDKASIEDTPSDNQMMLEDSVHVYKTDVSEDGSVTKADELDSSAYTTDFSSDSGFKLTFNNQINEPYIVEYQSFIQAAPGDPVGNDISFDGNNITEESWASEDSFEVRRTTGMGSGTGELADLTVTKQDAKTGEVLENAEFTLIDQGSGVEIQSGTTNADGEIVFEDLLLGDYQLREDQAPADYQSIEDPISVEVDESPESKVVTNELIPGSVELTKTAKEDNSKLLDGAVFELQNASTGEVVEEGLTTGDDGEGKIQVDDLRPGTYKFVETNAPANYQNGMESEAFTIERSATEADADHESITVENELIPGSVTLKKLDGVESTPLPDAVFELQEETSDGSWEVMEENLTTDENGEINVDNLAPGRYQFVETEAPDDYELNTNPIPFDIEKSPSESDVYHTTVTAHNNLAPGSVVITKADTDTGEVLQGAKFVLQHSDGTPVGEGVTRTTNENGQIIVEDLAPGSYQFEETKAPEHYEPLDEPVTFEIERGQEEAKQITAENELTPGSVDLNKVDKDNPDKTLQGAVFNVETQGGTTVRENVATDENGTVTVNDLRPGDYQFVETQAPENYQLDEEPVPFTIEKSQAETLTVTIENSLIQGSVQLTKVDEDNPDRALQGAVFDLETTDGETIREDLETDENGQIVVDNLYAGDYQFVETEAPKSYQPREEPVPFTIDQYKTEDAVKQETVQAENKLYPGSVQLVKTEENNPDNLLEGAVFELQTTDGETLQEGLTTGEDGRFAVNNLAPGEYQFVETEAPYDYWRNMDAVPFEIEEGQEEAVVVTVENQPLPDSSPSSPSNDEEGSVVLTKTAANDTEEALEGAVFELQEADGDVVEDDLTSNEEGEIEVSDLEPGSYQFVETEAPDGYLLDEEPVSFDIEEDEETTITIENEQMAGTATLTKVDSSDEEKRLRGAVFDLEEADGDIVEENLTTDENGEITVSGLEPGDYQFVEQQAPDGYQLNEDPMDFTIEENQEEMVTLTAENEAKPGAVQLTKTAAGNADEVLEGAVFTLEEADGTLVQEGLTTGEDGTITVTDLEPASYQFVETQAPDGYEPTSEPAAFTIEAGETGLVQVTVENEKTEESPAPSSEGSVALTKVDDTDADKLLSGAEFTLRNADGTTIEEGLTTNDSGKIFVNELEPGTYEFVETKAPEGYERDDSPVMFDIKENQEEAVNVTAVNTPASSDEASSGPEDEESPSNSGNDESADGRVEDSKGEGQTLPDTSTAIFNYGFLGVIAVIAGLFIRRRKKA